MSIPVARVKDPPSWKSVEDSVIPFEAVYPPTPVQELLQSPAIQRPVEPLTCPTTSSLYVGLVVPTPTLPNTARPLVGPAMEVVPQPIIPLPLTASFDPVAEVPIPKLPELKLSPTKVGEEVVAISWIVLTAPLLTEKLVELKLASPLTEVEASIPETVSVPPKETGEPETDSPVPAVAETVMEEFSSSEFWMEPVGNTTEPPLTSSPPDSTVPEVTVKLCPIPTLPETFMDDPTPRKPEK